MFQIRFMQSFFLGLKQASLPRPGGEGNNRRASFFLSSSAFQPITPGMQSMKQSTTMENLRSRIVSHAEKVKKVEEMEAVLAGVFSLEAQAERERFEGLVQRVIKPAFDEFKATLREIGRDAV